MGVTLTGYLDVPGERLGAVRAALPEHIRLTRAEPGCLRFDVAEQTSPRGRFAVAEAFADAEAFRAHQARLPGTEWARATEGLARTYEVTGLEE